jgi:hypothetical protein
VLAKSQSRYQLPLAVSKKLSGSYEEVRRRNRSSEGSKKLSGSYEEVRRRNRSSEGSKKLSGSYEEVRRRNRSSEGSKKLSGSYEEVRRRNRSSVSSFISSTEAKSVVGSFASFAVRTVRSFNSSCCIIRILLASSFIIWGPIRHWP